MPGMGAKRRFFLSGLGELFAPEVADRLQHPEPGLPAGIY